MTALDQAFIRAYQQNGEAPVAIPLEFARPVQLTDALSEPEPEPEAEADHGEPCDALADAVVEALAKPSETLAGREVEGRSNRTREADTKTKPAQPDSDAPVPSFLNATADAAPAPPLVEALGILGDVQKPSSDGENKEPQDATPEPHPREEVFVQEEPAEEPPTDQGSTVGSDFREPIRPMLQVDSLTWPRVCNRMSRAARAELDQLADALQAGQRRGQKIVALAGHRHGAGCTTLLLSVARRLADRGQRVVVVDADLGDPQLARRLALLPEAGWEEVVAGQVELAEVLIESVADRLAILPWCGPRSTGGETMLTHPPRRDTLEPLRANYDLVLIDLGAIGTKRSGTAETATSSGDPWLDAVVLIHDVRHTPRQHLRRIQEYLDAANVPQAGIAENFAA